MPDQISANQRLVSFMQRKSELLATPELFTSEDADELLAWSEAEAQWVIDKINFSWDSDCCPWCIYHDYGCGQCTYANRHGKCKDSDIGNTYGKIMEKLFKKNFGNICVSLTANEQEELEAILKGDD